MEFQKEDFGSKVIEVINKENLKDVVVETFGYNDCFVEHGNVEELEKKYKMDTQSILNKILKKFINL